MADRLYLISEYRDPCVQLGFNETTVGLTITDDGKGFDVEKAVAGLGLKGMRDRAREIGGTFQ